MKYLILIHSNPASRALWERLGDDDLIARGRARDALNEVLLDSGEYVVAEGLSDPNLARRVSVLDGSTVISDGPFAESKEYLAGFYLIECESSERALELAAQIPDAATGGVEVRPVLQRGGLEM